MPLYLTIYDRSEAKPKKNYKNNMLKPKYNGNHQLIQSHDEIEKEKLNNTVLTGMDVIENRPRERSASNGHETAGLLSTMSENQNFTQ